MRPSSAGSGQPVGHLPAQPVAEREVDEDQPDDVRPDDRRAPEVGREQPRGGDLGRERPCARREDDQPSVRGRQRRVRRRGGTSPPRSPGRPSVPAAARRRRSRRRARRREKCRQSTRMASASSCAVAACGPRNAVQPLLAVELPVAPRLDDAVGVEDDGGARLELDAARAAYSCSVSIPSATPAAAELHDLAAGRGVDRGGGRRSRTANFAPAGSTTA